MLKRDCTRSARQGRRSPCLKTLFQLQRDFGLLVFESPVDIAVVEGVLHIQLGCNDLERKAWHAHVQDINLLPVLAQLTQEQVFGIVTSLSVQRRGVDVEARIKG